MPFVEISEEDYRRLQQLAGIFDVPQVITRLLDQYEFEEDETPAKAPTKPIERMTFGISELPNLSFAKFESGTIDGVRPASNNWNSLMALALKTAHDKLGNFDELTRVTSINLIEEVKEDEGYTELTGHNLSYQRQSATLAAKCIAQICKNLEMSLQIDFRWRHREGAEHPGQTGRIVSTG